MEDLTEKWKRGEVVGDLEFSDANARMRYKSLAEILSSACFNGSGLDFRIFNQEEITVFVWGRATWCEVDSYEAARAALYAVEDMVNPESDLGIDADETRLGVELMLGFEAVIIRVLREHDAAGRQCIGFIALTGREAEDILRAEKPGMFPIEVGEHRLAGGHVWKVVNVGPDIVTLERKPGDGTLERCPYPRAMAHQLKWVRA